MFKVVFALKCGNITEDININSIYRKIHIRQEINNHTSTIKIKRVTIKMENNLCDKFEEFK